MNDTELLTPYLGSTVDSLQFAWEFLDADRPGDLTWGFHLNVQWLVDNVSFGHWDGAASIFTASSITLFSDTFSRVDPAHTPQLENGEEGDWIGNGGTRPFADVDSLSVQVQDANGVTAGNVRLVWRVGAGTPPAFGAWSEKAMVFAEPDPSSPTDEGTYRGTMGNTSTEDYSADEAGSLGNADLDPIWDAGTTVEYYVAVTDDASNVAVFPETADDAPTPVFLRFQVLPFNRLAGSGENARRILLVDDYGRRNLDFEHSHGFDPDGGAGFGTFSDPAWDQPEDMVERALALMYGGSEDFQDNVAWSGYGAYGSPKWDVYNVQGAGSSQQREPRVLANAANGLGGICTDDGVPQYDAVIWLNGSFDAYSFADTTRIELKSFLDHGGHLFSSGDDVAAFLGEGGADADSVVDFLGPYMGIAFPNFNDDQADDRAMYVWGVGGTSLEAKAVGLYGDCPGLRHAFDKLTLATATPGVNVNSTLATYEESDAATNGRAAIVKNVRVAGNGVCVHCGFALESLLADQARACLLDAVFEVDFGLPTTAYLGCFNIIPAAVTSDRSGFDLAQARPNPFADVTSIRFSVPARMHARVELYNVLGQKVRTLVDEVVDANVHSREWDGRSDSGVRLSSGVYFVKMFAGDYSATRKVVRLN
jgi:hypothetical protein